MSSLAGRALSPRGQWVALAVWAAGLTLLAYGRALALPFFFDDFVHLPYVDEHTLGELWRTPGNLAYYRPLPFTVWKLLHLTLGAHIPAVHHALNLLLHAANGLLVGWLAAALWPRSDGSPHRPRAFVAAALFLLFPFSYQGVPWAGSLAHLLVTFLVLASVATYWQMARTGRLAWGGLSLALALLAPFAHENGALVGPLIAAVLLTRPGGEPRRVWPHAALWTLPALVWLPIWWLAPRAAGGGIERQSLEAIWQNAAYFLQGAGYPLTWLGGRLRAWTGMNDLAAVALLGLGALLAAAALQVAARPGRRALLPWLWLALAALPAVLFLRFDYVINGPRLLMLASAGAGWLWTDAAFALAAVAGRAGSKGGRAPAAGLLVAGLLAGLLVQNLAFIGRRMIFHTLLGQSYRAAITAAAAAADDGRAAILVNLPSWIAPDPATYALGHEGVLFWPDYARPEALVAVNTGRPARVILARNDAIRPAMPYFYGLAGGAADWPAWATQPGEVFVARYAAEGVSWEAAGRLGDETTAGAGVARFGDGAIGLQAAEARRVPGGVEVNLAWRVDRPPADQVTAFVHVLDGDGRLLAQADGDPLGGNFPFAQWPAGMAAIDRRFVPFGDRAARVLVGLYDRLTGERLPAAAGGVALGEDAFALPVP